ncbi:hypothetical protein [Tenacibaculum sp. SZ-18]|uniref:hypothetical protein n=1 Tax=Tenacibaculum sp. SZ-18 TaxID=754423 RepID=UPI0012FE222B|nr:hypothetical protein [Tenacibaculum sp. SZ-18]
MGNHKKRLKLDKFRVTKIKNSSEIFGGAANGGENPDCSLTKLTTTAKDKNKGNNIVI